MPLFTSDQVVAILADVYYDAAKRKANMRAAAEVLESLRATLSNEENVIKLWAVINDHVGRAEPDRLQSALIQMREQFERVAIAKEIERLADIFERDREEGWHEWLRTYVAAFDDAGWWLTFCVGLASAPLPFPAQMEPSIEQMRYYTKCLLEERWAEAYDWVLFLSRQEIQSEQRANMLVIAGEIELYHFLKHDKAKELFELAQQLAPDNLRVLTGWAEFWLEQPDGLERAKEDSQRMIEAKPSFGDGFVLLGDCYLKAGDLIGAETQYQQAIRNAPSNSGVYLRAIRLYSRRELFKTKRERLAGLIKLRIAVDPLSAYSTYLQEAETYQQNDLIEDAHRSTENAISLDGSQLGAYLSDGYIYLDESRSSAQHDECLTKARARFEKAVEVAPQALDGYWGMSWLCEEQGELAEALEWCTRSLGKRPQWETIIRARMGDLRRQLKQYEAAEQEFNLVLAIDPLHQQALKGLADLSRERMLLLNAEGNNYYTQGEYRKAIERYNKAIEFDPSDGVLYSNLAGAWEQLKEPGGRVSALNEAIETFKRAQSVSVAEKHEASIERLKQKKEFALLYGELYIDWLHVVTPIAVEVAKNLIPFTEGRSGSSLSDELLKNITDMRLRIQNDFGVQIPGVRFRGNDTDLPSGAYIIMINEIPLVMGTIEVDQRFFPGSAEALAAIGVEGKATTSPFEGLWISDADWKKVESAGLELWGVIEYPIRHLGAVVQRNLTEFLGHQEVAKIIEIELPGTLAELRSSSGKLRALTQVCRGLVVEGVPIKPFGEIYKDFDRLYSGDVNFQDIVESIRSLPVLRARLPGNDRRFSILPLDARFEAEIRNSIYQSGGHAVLAMEPENCQNALTAFRNSVEQDRKTVVVVDDPKLRPFVRTLIELEFPNIPVLSRSEHLADLELRTMAPVEFKDRPAPENQNFRSSRQLADSDNQIAGIAADASPDSGKIPITVFVNEVFGATRSHADDRSIEETFSMMREGLFHELGIILPEVRMEIDNRLKPNEIRFKLDDHECPAFAGLESDEFLVNDVRDRLKQLLNIDAREARNPANGDPCAIVQEIEETVKVCREAGLTIWGPSGFLVLALSAEIRKNAATFQTIAITEYILEALRGAFPELIDAALRRFSVKQCCLVLRDLLEEEISIRDLRSILESMLSVSGTTDVDQVRYIVFIPHAEGLLAVTGAKSVDNLAIADYSSYVRTSLKKYISHKYTRGQSTLVVYLLDPDIERRIGDIGAQPLTAEEREEFREAFSLEFGRLPSTSQNGAVLTSMDIRRTVRKLIQADFPYLAVLAYQELSPEMNIQPVARISWKGLTKEA